MTLNGETAHVLKWGTLTGLSVMTVGLLLSMLGFPETVLEAGILILIFSPVAGIAVSTKCLIDEKDAYWIKIAFLLIAVIVIGSLISFFA